MSYGDGTGMFRRPPGQVLRRPRSGARSAASVGVVRVAAFASPGLAACGERLGFPLAVIVATDDPGAHLARLVRTQHACWTLAEDWAFDGVGGAELDPSAPNFEQLRFDPRWLGGRRCPAGMALDGGSLLVALPPGVARDRFSEELKSALRPMRFDVHGARPGLVLRRRATGRPFAVTARYSLRGVAAGGATSFVLVDDLYAFRPKSLPSLVAAATAARDRAAAFGAVAALLSTR